MSGLEGAFDNVITVLGFSAMDTMFGCEQIVVICPLSCWEKIVAQFGDLNSLCTKPANRLSICLPINGSSDLWRPVESFFNVGQVVGYGCCFPYALFQPGTDDFPCNVELDGV
jgi:hypothetical protein